uniref:Tr-type G domain-containing protein n=1 Tax=Astyanax mexicanus TaxID=7994 RepID=A0A8B9HDY4_ASTMX
LPLDFIPELKPAYVLFFVCKRTAVFHFYLKLCSQFLDLRVAVLGNVDSGKSTLLGVLTQGELDNGRGRARLNLFRHLHEIQTGRTSSISFEILGFDSKGEVSIRSLVFSNCFYLFSFYSPGKIRSETALLLIPFFSKRAVKCKIIN